VKPSIKLSRVGERMWDVSKKTYCKDNPIIPIYAFDETWISITFAQQYSQLDHMYAWKFVQFLCVKNNWVL
jgi:hypothetical protein